MKTPLRGIAFRAANQWLIVAHFLRLGDLGKLDLGISTRFMPAGEPEMNVMNRLGVAFGLLFLLAFGRTAPAQTSGTTPPPPPPGRVASPPLEGPVTDLEPIRPDDTAGRVSGRTDQDPAPAAASHDALQDKSDRPNSKRVYAPKQPPRPIAERPSGPRPDRRATWVPGYWEWDPGRAEFVWIGGVWQMPPPGSIWVTPRWMGDRGGWYRTSGFWSGRRDNGPIATTYSTANQPAWRTTGPPAGHPDDNPAAAPGPDYFYVPGHYVPTGDQLKWKPGFWARAQAGWDWIPARWVRRAAGWEFRAGYWVAEPASTRTDGAVDRPPAADAPRPANSNAVDDRPLPPAGREDERDVIAETEVRVNRDGSTTVVVPAPGLPYYVIRPPGLYPYGPGGVVVPGAVPPFVRRLLDQVLP
jgi:hypothetical protein